MVIIVVGAQWGDEGKGKIVDKLAQKADVVGRWGGGANAGHTLENEFGKLVVRLVPSGICNPNAICMIGNGTVVDPEVLLEEIGRLNELKIPTTRLMVSSLAHMVMPWHRALDIASEEARGPSAVGTTKKGIGPCYQDKAGRSGIRMGEIRDLKEFEAKLTAQYQEKRSFFRLVYPKHESLFPSFGKFMDQYLDFAVRLAPFVHDTDLIMREMLSQGKTVLLEGAQGAMIDLDMGTYPFVTASSTTAAGACVGVGIPPTAVSRVIAVAKAYTTRVGNGPFPTENSEEDGVRMRDIGHEYGSVTGRERRCGWFDAPMVRYACQLNGATEVILTKLDVLSTWERIKVAVGYEDSLATHPAALWQKPPIYMEVSGWGQSLDGVRTWNDLPQNARFYVDMLAEHIGVRITAVSIGPHRDAIIWRDPK